MVNTMDYQDTQEDENELCEAPVPLTQRRDYFSLLEISVKSDPRHIHDLVKHLRSHFSELRLESETVEDLVLLIDEAVTNTAEHAHKYDPDKKVDIKITIKPTKIQILVKGELKAELINNPRFIEFLKRLIKEKIVSTKKVMEFFREFEAEELLTHEKAHKLKEEFHHLEETPTIDDIDLLLQDFLDERGRGIILIKELTEGKMKVDIIGRMLTFVMTKNLKKVGQCML